MPILVSILIVLTAIAVIALITYVVRSVGESAGLSTAGSESPVSRRPQPIVNEFHVKGDTATALFAVPLGDSEAGEHLVNLLSASAVEYVRERVHDGLPLDGVVRIEVSAMRGDHPEKLRTVELPEVGVLPDRDDRVLVEPAHDPIAAVHAVVADASVAPSAGSAPLGSISELVELSAPTEAHLRAIGVDTGTMDLGELIIGLLRVSGYDVHVGRTGMSGLVGIDGGKADAYGLTRDGRRTILIILRHAEGSHPEIEDSVLAKFAVEVAQLNPDQAILVTDKYSPYSMYEREKRDKRCAYITRERLQAFVDSFGLA